jgi:membrane-associated phospholipid phosphatase
MSGRHQDISRTTDRRRFTVLDRITLGYIITFILGLLLLGRGNPSWLPVVAMHVGILAVAVFIILRWNDCTTGLRGFLRQLYPGLLYPFFYNQAEHATHWVHPAFLDHQVVALERAVFGVDPNVWIQPVQAAPVNEWMMAGYFAYYLLVPILVLPLHFSGRTLDVRRILTATTITFVISYVGFALYPVEGPRFYLAEQFAHGLSGWAFVPLVNWIIAGAAFHGGCMPSSHAAVALVVLLWARRTRPGLARWLAPLVFTLFFATVWGRFHYVTDVVIGWVVGFIGFALADRLCKMEGAASVPDAMPKQAAPPARFEAAA